MVMGDDLLATIREARHEHEKAEQRRRQPLDCPDHLWPLQPLGAGRYHCKFGGHVVIPAGAETS